MPRSFTRTAPLTTERCRRLELRVMWFRGIRASGPMMNASDDFARYDLVVDNADPVDMIHKVVRRLNPDLLVLGSHGRSRFGRALFGSVANRVMRTAGCDCLIVPEQSINIAWRSARDARLSLNVVSGA